MSYALKVICKRKGCGLEIYTGLWVNSEKELIRGDFKGRYTCSNGHRHSYRSRAGEEGDYSVERRRD